MPERCGATGAESCCASIEVPSGTYARGYDLAGAGDVGSPATVSAFLLDKYEVTVGRFRAFVAQGLGTRGTAPASGDGAHPALAGSGWNASWNSGLAKDPGELVTALACVTPDAIPTWTRTPGANEDRPITCITWYEAMAFCIWDGGYLPTEAEWNYVAAGGDEQRAYPWSQPASALLPLGTEQASYGDGASCVGDGVEGCTVEDLVLVGSKPGGDGRWGHAELAGNVAEWNLDLYGSLFPDPTDCTDCAKLSAGTLRVLRGGGYQGEASALRSGTRGMAAPAERSTAYGVRCARPPSPPTLPASR